MDPALRRQVLPFLKERPTSQYCTCQRLRFSPGHESTTIFCLDAYPRREISGLHRRWLCCRWLLRGWRAVPVLAPLLARLLPLLALSVRQNVADLRVGVAH